MMPLLELEQTFPEAPERCSQPSCLMRVTCSLCRYAKGRSFLDEDHLSSWASRSLFLSLVSTTPKKCFSSELCTLNWKWPFWPVSPFELNVIRIQMLQFAAPLWGGVGETVLGLNCIVTLRHNAFCFSGAPCLSGFGIWLCAVFTLYLPFWMHDS